MDKRDFNKYFEAVDVKPYIDNVINVANARFTQVTNGIIDRTLHDPKASAATIEEVSKFTMADGTKCITIRWTRTIYTRDEVSDKTENGTFVIPYWILCEPNPVDVFLQAQKTSAWKEIEKVETKQT